MKTPSLIRYSLFLATAVAAMPVASAQIAEPLYAEYFNNDAGGNRSLNFVSWKAYVGTTATEWTGNGQNGLISSAAGAAGGLNTGYLYSQMTQSGRYLYTSQSAISGGLDLSAGGYQVEFDLIGANAIGRVQVAFQIDNTWYVSNTQFTPYVAGSYLLPGQTGYDDAYGEYHKVLSVSATAADWSELILIPGQQMGISETALSQDLNLANITGIGLYLTNTSATQGGVVRIDSLVVTQVPEPATVAAIFAAGALVLAGVMRRRSLK